MDKTLTGLLTAFLIDGDDAVREIMLDYLTSAGVPFIHLLRSRELTSINQGVSGLIRDNVETFDATANHLSWIETHAFEYSKRRDLYWHLAFETKFGCVALATQATLSTAREVCDVFVYPDSTLVSLNMPTQLLVERRPFTSQEVNRTYLHGIYTADRKYRKTGCMLSGGSNFDNAWVRVDAVTLQQTFYRPMNPRPSPRFLPENALGLITRGRTNYLLRYDGTEVAAISNGNRLLAASDDLKTVLCYAPMTSPRGRTGSVLILQDDGVTCRTNTLQHVRQGALTGDGERSMLLSGNCRLQLCDRQLRPLWTYERSTTEEFQLDALYRDGNLAVLRSDTLLHVLLSTDGVQSLRTLFECECYRVVCEYPLAIVYLHEHRLKLAVYNF